VLKKVKMLDGILLNQKEVSKHLYPTITEGKFKGCIGAGGLLLARYPERYLL
jgi:hypothetical protein